MLGRQVRQALQVYTTHATFWVWVASWLLYHVLFSLVRTVESRELFVVALIDGLLGFEIGQTLATQFSSPRARLLPGFAAAHLIAAGGLVAAAVSTHALLVWFAHGPMFSAIALTVGAIGGVILVTVNMGLAKYGSWLLLPLILLSLWAAETGWFSVVLVDPWFHGVLGCVGLIAMVAAVSRLVNMSEDSPGYSFIADGSDWNAELTATEDQPCRERAREAASYPHGRTIRDVAVTMLFRSVLHTGRWRRFMLFQIAYTTPILSALVTMAIVFLYLFVLRNNVRNHGEPLPRFMLCFLPFCSAMAATWKVWSMRHYYLPWEFLLPVGRREFIREMDLENTVEMTLAAAGHCLVILALVLFSAPRPPLAFVSAWLALIACQYLVGYNLLFWISGFSSSCLAAIALGIACFALSAVSMAMLGTTTPSAYWHGGTITVLVVSALSAFGLNRLARRRWCQVDFGS